VVERWPTGNYSEDYETGRAYAEPLLPLMLRNAGPPTLSHILGDMVEVVSRRRNAGRRHDKLSGIEIGFMRGLGDLIMCGIAAAVYTGRVGAGMSPKDAKPKHATVAAKLVGLLATSHREADARANAEILASLPKGPQAGRKRRRSARRSRR
jgi:hypothetical protein